MVKLKIVMIGNKNIDKSKESNDDGDNDGDGYDVIAAAADDDGDLEDGGDGDDDDCGIYSCGNDDDYHDKNGNYIVDYEDHDNSVDNYVHEVKHLCLCR